MNHDDLHIPIEYPAFYKHSAVDVPPDNSVPAFPATTLEVWPKDVNLFNVRSMYDKFVATRGGELYDINTSEAMFVMYDQHLGLFTLHASTTAIFWAGVQNSSSRWTREGASFPSVFSALESVLGDTIPRKVAYFEDSVTRLRWMADRIEKHRSLHGFTMWNADSTL